MKRREFLAGAAALAKEIIAKARAVVPSKPVTEVIISHHHFDHTSGAAQLREATGAEVLLHLKREQFLLARRGELDGQRLVDRRDGILCELHVDHGADDLDDFAGVH